MWKGLSEPFFLISKQEQCMLSHNYGTQPTYSLQRSFTIAGKVQHANSAQSCLQCSHTESLHPQVCEYGRKPLAEKLTETKDWHWRSGFQRLDRSENPGIRQQALHWQTAATASVSWERAWTKQCNITMYSEVIWPWLEWFDCFSVRI